MTARLVGWCPDCLLYVEPYKPGESCPTFHDDFDPDHPSRRLHKRRLFICDSYSCDAEGFFLRRDYVDHLKEHCP